SGAAGHLLGADGCARMRLRPAGKLLVVLAQQIERLLVELLKIEEHVARLLRHPDQLVDLDMHGGGVAVLRVLDHEHHQEGDDGGRGVDHEVPGVAEAEERPEHRPYNDAGERQQEGERTPGDMGYPLGEMHEPELTVGHLLFPYVSRWGRGSPHHNALT